MAAGEPGARQGRGERSSADQARGRAVARAWSGAPLVLARFLPPAERAPPQVRRPLPSVRSLVGIASLTAPLGQHPHALATIATRPWLLDSLRHVYVSCSISY